MRKHIFIYCGVISICTHSWFVKHFYFHVYRESRLTFNQYKTASILLSLNIVCLLKGPQGTHTVDLVSTFSPLEG